jgi:hypothetical protein
VQFHENERDRSTEEQFAYYFPTGPVEKTSEHPTCQTSKRAQGEEKKGTYKVLAGDRAAHCDLHGRVFLVSGARTEIGQVRRRDVVFAAAAAGPFPRWCSLQHTPPATTTCYEPCVAHSLSLLGERGAA